MPCSVVKWLALVGVTLSYLSASATNGSYRRLGPICDKLLTGDLQVQGSGRNDDVMPDFRKAAIDLTKLAAELGMATPPHRLVVVPGPQMNVLASLGRHSAPHWYDGLMILNNQKQSGNILEFVTKGCSVCRSYYSDLNDPRSQVSIIMHVLGHNDVAAHSNYMAAVRFDPMSSSAAFAEKVQFLYDHHDHDEVSLFVQWLFSTEYMQDLALSTFDSPEYFRSQSSGIGRVEHFSSPGKDNAYESDRNPKRSSASLLQALVENLPAGSPAWKKELAELFEKSRRYFSGNIATKIMNEGWATMSQYLLARHSTYTTDADLLTFGPLLANVAYPDLKNPYFLGLECWWHLWEKFKRRPDVKVLTPFEQDKRFIAYAHEVLATHDDYDFIGKALDQEWVDKNSLMLYRKATDKDPIPLGTDLRELNIALSRDARRIVRYIQRLVAAKHLTFPRVLITDFNWRKQGMVHLSHEAFEGIPLKFDSAVKALFVLAQLFERPVVLEAEFGNGNGQSVPQMPIIVEPSGKVNLTSPQQGLPIQAAAQKILDDFKGSVAKVVNPDFRKARLDEAWRTNLTAMMDAMFYPIHKSMLYAPYADSAIVEYNNLVERLVVEAALAAIRTGQQPQVANGNVIFNVLPDIPHFELDLSVRNAKIRNQAPAPVDHGIYTPAGLDNIGQDDSSILTQGLKLPGEVFKGKPKDGKGKGKGKGKPQDSDDDGEDGEPIYNPNQPSQPGQGNAGDVAMPMEFWGRLLKGQLELPNLRRTNGPSTEIDRIRRGTARRPKGYEHDEKTLMNAIEKAIAIRRGKGLPFRIGPDLDRQTLVREAYLYMDKGDVVVSDHMQIPIPDHKAVLVVAGDLTGSMAGDRVEMAKQLIFNIQALLRAQYKAIEIRYVGFSDSAKEFEEDEFFKSFFGGGTSYVSGLKLTSEILSTYDNNEYNKFVLLVGDGESYDQNESLQVMDKLTPDLQFFSFAVTTGDYGSFASNPFVQAYVNYQRTRWPWLGIAELKKMADVIPSLKKLFPKDQAASPGGR